MKFFDIGYKVLDAKLLKLRKVLVVANREMVVEHEA